MKMYQFPEDPAPKHGTWAMMVSDLLDEPTIHTGEWQSMDTSGSEMHRTHELEDVSLVWDRVPTSSTHLMVPGIDKDWAKEHFLERVSGQPLNPAPSHLRWPYAVRGNADHTTDTKFDHTYPERFWPQHVDGRGRPRSGWEDPVSGRTVLTPQAEDGMYGIRFRYGDLSDVVDLLVRSPLTRQAYLPVWFPEDTGAHHGQRVPCTLGYHFMQRGGRLSCRYYLRSCDVYRHLANDIYFAARLTDWVANQVTEKTNGAIHFRPGGLVMHISSLHAFVADEKKIRERLEA
jgi:hypothetical protein